MLDMIITFVSPTAEMLEEGFTGESGDSDVSDLLDLAGDISVLPRLLSVL